MNVVLVEDSVELLEGWVELLELDGHTVKAFTNAKAVLADPAVLNEATILVTDYYLPDLNGVELIMRARAIHPELSAILLTGTRDASIEEKLRRLPNTLLLNKPIGIDELEAAFAELSRPKVALKRKEKSTRHVGRHD